MSSLATEIGGKPKRNLQGEFFLGGEGLYSHIQPDAEVEFPKSPRDLIFKLNISPYPN